MTPQNDGKLIRLNVPQLTEDRRKVTCRSLRPRAVLRVLTRRAAARRSSLSLPRASGRRARWRSATSAATPSTRSKSWKRCAHARTHARPLTALAARRLTRARGAGGHGRGREQGLARGGAEVAQEVRDRGGQGGHTARDGHQCAFATLPHRGSTPEAQTSRAAPGLLLTSAAPSVAQ